MLAPGATIGILGGGQLGRMLALAAARLGFDVHIFTPEPDSPASRVSAHTTVAAYDDAAALAAFACRCDVVTYEFENVPAATAQAVIDAGVPLYPNATALAVAQDRVQEKQFLNQCGCPTADFRPIDGPDQVARAVADLGGDVILKTRRDGYDGKGQMRVCDPTQVATVWETLGARPLIAEARVPFVAEMSIIAARAQDGTVRCFDMARNTHTNGILSHSSVPAQMPDAACAEARAIAERLLAALGYVGVIGIEFFIEACGTVRVNEFAPRVHNSGHWTMDACDHDQFDLHIRAVAGWPWVCSCWSSCRVAPACGWPSRATIRVIRWSR